MSNSNYFLNNRKHSLKNDGVSFLNSEILLFNFEDDTFRPVIYNLNTDIEYIKKLYDECNIALEIEHTNNYVKSGNNPFEDKMLCDIGIEKKQDFVTNYLPSLLKLKDLFSEVSLNQEQIYFSNSKNTNVQKEKNDYKTTKNLIEKLGLHIPENMSDKDLNNIQERRTSYIQKMFPEYDKYVSLEKNEKIVEFNSNSKCENYILKAAYCPYNITYNVLYPEF